MLIQLLHAALDISLFLLSRRGSRSEKKQKDRWRSIEKSDAYIPLCTYKSKVSESKIFG